MIDDISLEDMDKVKQPTTKQQEMHKYYIAYRTISNIRRTKPPNLIVSRLVLQMFLPNPMKPGVKSRMKM